MKKKNSAVVNVTFASVFLSVLFGNYSCREASCVSSITDILMGGCVRVEVKLKQKGQTLGPIGPEGNKETE